MNKSVKKRPAAKPAAESAKKRPAAKLADAKRCLSSTRLVCRRPASCPRSIPAPLASSSGFNGQQLHAVQIGLGTHGTLPENLAGDWPVWCPCLDWLLRATSLGACEKLGKFTSIGAYKHAQDFRGIVVEPVP